MITYWQQENGRLVKKDEEEIDSGRNTWVDARCVTRDDIKELEEKFGVEQENLLDFLDPDELSRIEKNEDENYIVTIIRLPVFSPSDDVSYFTAPLGIIIKDRFFITICWTDCEVLKDFAANRVKELSLKDFPAFTIRFMARADMMFLRYLKELNRRTTSIQNEVMRSVQNQELVQLQNIQKSLVYFTTSLKSNQMLLEKFRKTRIIKLDEEDQDWIDDVEIDNRQALEMADTYTQLMAQTNDTLTSIISNNLNIVMKKLAILNLVLMAPTLITSFYGMNVKLPFENTGKWAVVIVTVLCLVSIFITNAFLKLSDKPVEATIRKKTSLKQKQAERKQKNYLKKQDKIAEKRGKK
ncbi:magnesium transporter CorA family protein [Treponema sp.]|uniref:magnesium transporter CorA family protein n=1 Tax=Treponema sp. TaxID=166 RepID=UPI001DB79195|nr:magnesium transporter CorA family protein [Treponema sp.]MBS7241240.1 magnesium transporter CorA family protein [Treponema sp.]MCI6442993.1 magnesium transporter CorA family protein [Spirochaetia bacterium]MDY4132008.1 magnesium transporter CorA family protein [Treponema sp.]